MNRSDLQALQAVRGYPAVTILLPTERAYPADQQNAIRIKNLVREATNRLLAEFPRRAVSHLLSRLNGVAAHIDYRFVLEGLAIFAHNDLARAFVLPIPVREQVLIDETFATRDLLYALHRSQRYWTLVLSEQPTRLYEGVRDSLLEVKGRPFPMIHQGPGGATVLPTRVGVEPSTVRDRHHRQFFRRVDRAFGKLAAVDPLPLAIVGVDRYQAFFDEVTSHKELIAARVYGSHDATPAPELAKLVWPEVRASFDRERQDALHDLDQAVGAGRSATGIADVWTAAHDARCETLLVEQDFHHPAKVDPSGRHLLPADDAAAPGVLDDAVDELIELVVSQGGHVVFVEPNALAQHQRIAAILRY